MDKPTLFSFIEAQIKSMNEVTKFITSDGSHFNSVFDAAEHCGKLARFQYADALFKSGESLRAG